MLTSFRKCLPVAQSFFKPVTTLSRREVHLDIWQSTPVNSSPSSPTVILLGYAGSPKHHLTKFEDLYNNLGYRSISSIMPHKHIFEYDVASIRDCAIQVLDKIQENEADKIVIHAFSNNGIIMYQHLYNILQQQNKMDLFKGLILDSGPGPMSLRDNYFKKNYKDNQTKSFLPIALYSVNAANKVPLSENIKQVKATLKVLGKNFAAYKNVPWTGAFLTHHEQGTWPLLLLYSKEDVLMPYTYLERMLEHQKSRNPDRQIISNKFVGSGHVAHYKKFPDQYVSLVQNFLKSL